MRENFISNWIRRNRFLIILIVLGIFVTVGAYYWKWIRPLLGILVVLAIGYYWLPIIGFFKYHFYWEFKEKLLEYDLNPIWKRAGIIEIKGGTESGKSLLLILLTKHLKGRKWNNIPNTIPGCQYLDLAVLKQHREGNYKEGLTGNNNILFIDEIWSFFSKREANKAQVNLSSLLWFLSETSKTNWKIFYVTKQGARLRNELALLTENKSGIVKVKRPRLVTNYWSRKYYCLDIEFEEKKIAIPFTDLDLYTFDNAWNVDEQYAMNSFGGAIEKMKPDKLQQMLGMTSRTQQMREKAELESWAKHSSDTEIQGMMHSRMKKKFWEMKRKEGWTSLKEKAETTGIELTENELKFIASQVDKNHRRDSRVWEKTFEMKINLAKLKKSKGEKIIESDESASSKTLANDLENTEPANNIEGNINIEKIYKKVSQKYREGSPKWNRAVEQEIDKERKRLKLNIDHAEKEPIEEEINEEREE